MHRHPPFHTEGSASVLATWQCVHKWCSGAVVCILLSNAIFMACSYLLHRKNSISFILFCHLITNATMRLLRLLPKVPVTTCLVPGSDQDSVSDSAFCSRRYLALLLLHYYCYYRHMQSTTRSNIVPYTDNTLGKQNNRHT